MSAFAAITSASPPIADVNGYGAGCPVMTQAVRKLFSRPERATLIRVTAVAGNNDSRVRNCRIYCCADALPTRVFTQPGPLADIAHETVRYSLRVRPHSAKWSRGRAFDRQIGSTKRGDRYADCRIRTGFVFDRPIFYATGDRKWSSGESRIKGGRARRRGPT